MRSSLTAVMAVLMVGAAACGDDGTGAEEALYPDFSGTWAMRLTVTGGGVVCVEQGTLTVNHASTASATFTGQASLLMECFDDLRLVSSQRTDTAITDGRFGERASRGSWSVSFGVRPGWTYTGEAFVNAAGRLVIEGGGAAATFDPGNGAAVGGSTDWTICREFLIAGDPVERGCA